MSMTIVLYTGKAAVGKLVEAGLKKGGGRPLTVEIEARLTPVS